MRLKKNIPASPYQPESVQSQSPSESTTSESTPSTSDLLKNQIKQKSQEIIKERTLDQFANNPLFNPVTNPNAEKNRQVFLEHTNQIPKEEARTLYNTPIIPYVKGTSTKDLVELGGDMIKNAAAGVNAGLEKFNQGLGTLVGALGSQTGESGIEDIAKSIIPIPGQAFEKSDFGKAGEVTKGVLEAATGATQAGFAGATVVQPQLAAFVATSDEVKKVADKNLPEYEAKFVNNVVDFPFAAATKSAEALGFDPKEYPNWSMLLELTDLAAVVAGGHYIAKSKGAEPVTSFTDWQELSKRAAENKLSPEEKTKVSEAIADVTPEQIVEEAKKRDTPAAQEIVQKFEEAQKPEEPAHSPEMEQLVKEHEDLTNAVAETPQEQEMKGQGLQQIAGKIEDLQAAELKAQEANAHTMAELNDINERIKATQEFKDKNPTLPGVGKMTEETISHLTEQKNKLETLIPKENAIQEQSPSSQISHTGETRQNITEGGEGVRQSEQRIKPTEESNQEKVTPEISKEAEYSEIKNIRSEKIRTEKMRNFVETNFDSVVAQLMLKNKIKRRC